jgi:hypothetical protein
MKPSIQARKSSKAFAVALLLRAAPGSVASVFKRYEGEDAVIPVRGAQGFAVTRRELVFADFEIAQNRRIEYFAVVKSGEIVLTTDSAVVEPIDYGRDILVDLADPLRSMLVWVESFNSYTYGISQNVQRVWGRPDPVVVSGVREMFSGTLNLLTLELPERKSLLEIVNASSIVGFSPQFPKYGLDDFLYFSVGNVVEGRPSTRAAESARRWGLEVQQVAAPPAEFSYPLHGLKWSDLAEKPWSDWGDFEWWEVVV